MEIVLGSCSVLVGSCGNQVVVNIECSRAIARTFGVVKDDLAIEFSS